MNWLPQFVSISTNFPHIVDDFPVPLPNPKRNFHYPNKLPKKGKTFDMSVVGENFYCVRFHSKLIGKGWL